MYTCYVHLSLHTCVYHLFSATVHAVSPPSKICGGHFFETFNVGQHGEFGLQITVPFGLYLTLVWFFSNLINAIHHIHAFNDGTKRGKPHSVQIGVVAKVDEHLCRSGVGPACGKRHHTTSVALCDWIIHHFLFTPDGRLFWIAMDTKLCHETGNHSKKTNAFEKIVVHHFADALGAQWCLVEASSCWSCVSLRRICTSNNIYTVTTLTHS